jgi:hypothetical protein
MFGQGSRRGIRKSRLRARRTCDLLAAILHLLVGDEDTFMTSPADPLDDYIAAAAATLDLPLQPDWTAAVKANLAVTLRHAATVAEFALPDEAEQAPVFKA